MTAAFRSAAPATSVTDTLTISKPAGVVDGDILIWVQGSRASGNGLSITTPPSGFTPGDSQAAGITPDTQGFWFYKVASSEGASWSSVLSAAPTGSSGAVLAFTSGNTSTPIAASSKSATNGGTTVSAPTVTTTEDNQLVLGLVVSNWAEGTWTKPAGTPTTTERADVQSGVGAHQTTLEVFEFTQISAGATTARSATLSLDNDAGVGFQIALKNAAAAGGLKGNLSLLGVGT